MSTRRLQVESNDPLATKVEKITRFFGFRPRDMNPIHDPTPELNPNVTTSRRQFLLAIFANFLSPLLFGIHAYCAK